MAVLAALVSFIISCERNDQKENTDDEVSALDTFAQGLVKPIGIENAGDSRLFVIEQDGTVTIIDSAGNLNPVKFLDISDEVVTGGEQGLLGLAFHPDYINNGWFYVNYIGEGDSTRISRFSVTPANPDQADPESEQRILTLAQPYKNHNGGALKFGPDGYLYLGLGDGGSADDPQNRAQNLMEPYGKILRLDVSPGTSYAIPSTNPFVNDTSALPEIWAYGLRNPWRFSFDRLTGDLWIADVGQREMEEINMQAFSSSGGENYGWRCYEGSLEFNLDNCNTSAEFVFPVYEYRHLETECSVTGGYVYRGNEGSKYYGRYFYADFCSDKIWTLRNEGGTWISEQSGPFTGNGFSTFGEDCSGNLYIAGYTSGTIFRIIMDNSAL